MILEPVAVLHDAPGFREPVHGHREVLPVELLRHLRVAEHHQAQQWQHRFKGRYQLLVQAVIPISCRSAQDGRVRYWPAGRSTGLVASSRCWRNGARVVP